MATPTNGWDAVCIVGFVASIATVVSLSDCRSPAQLEQLGKIAEAEARTAKSQCAQPPTDEDQDDE